MTDDEEEDAICGKLIKIGRGRGRMVTAPVLGGGATSLQVRKYQQDPSGRLYKRWFFWANKQQQFLKVGGTTTCQSANKSKTQKTRFPTQQPKRVQSKLGRESDVWRRRQ